MKIWESITWDGLVMFRGEWLITGKKKWVDSSWRKKNSRGKQKITLVEVVKNDIN